MLGYSNCSQQYCLISNIRKASQGYTVNETRILAPPMQVQKAFYMLKYELIYSSLQNNIADGPIFKEMLLNNFTGNLAIQQNFTVMFVKKSWGVDYKGLEIYSSGVVRCYGVIAKLRGIANSCQELGTRASTISVENQQHKCINIFKINPDWSLYHCYFPTLELFWLLGKSWQVLQCQDLLTLFGNKAKLFLFSLAMRR